MCVTFAEMEQYAYCCCEVGIPYSEAQLLKVASLSCRDSAQADAHVAGLSWCLTSPSRSHLWTWEQELPHTSQEGPGPRGETYSRVNDEFTGFGQVLGQEGSPHVTAQCILEEKETNVISVAFVLN